MEPTGVDAIFAAASLTGMSTNATTLIVAAIGLCILFVAGTIVMKGAKFAKKA